MTSCLALLCLATALPAAAPLLFKHGSFLRITQMSAAAHCPLVSM